MKGEEMEAHKACPAAAWWRREFNPGLSDFRACALSTCFTASRRQGARRLLLVAQVRDDEGLTRAEAREARWEPAGERLKRVRWLPGCGWEEEKKVIPGSQGRRCLLLTCDWIKKQGSRSKGVVLVPRIDMASGSESTPSFVTAEITKELSRSLGLSFRFVWRDYTWGPGKRRKELSWRILSSFMLSMKPGLSAKQPRKWRREQQWTEACLPAASH